MRGILTILFLMLLFVFLGDAGILGSDIKNSTFIKSLTPTIESLKASVTKITGNTSRSATDTQQGTEKATPSSPDKTTDNWIIDNEIVRR